MRKLLLAGIAAVGLAGAAQAQTQMIKDTDDAKIPAVGPYASPLGAPAPAPGQFVVRLNGTVRYYFAYATQPGVGPEGQKVASTHNLTLIRLYPGFDAVAANGLKYGISAEIREDGGSPAGASPTSETAKRNYMYWRRAYGYVGGNWGKIQVGMGDGPVSSMATGQMYELGEANFCGDMWGITAGLNGTGPYPFVACTGSMYSTNKIAYYSPQFMGFDFGIAYEHDTGTGGGVSGCTTPAKGGPDDGKGPYGCNSATSSWNSDDLKRRRNLIDVALRYRGKFGGVGVAAAGGYVHAGKVNEPGGWSDYEDLSFGWGGLKLDYMGFSLQGAIQGGDQNRNSLNKKGAPSQLSWQIGTSYTNGPLLAGVSYFEMESAGAWSSPGNAKRKDKGVYVGVNYGIAPGLSVLAAYAWAQSEQAGKDINAFKANTQSKEDAQMATVGVIFRW